METLLLPFSPRYIVLTICAVVTALLMALTWNVGANVETAHSLSPVRGGEDRSDGPLQSAIRNPKSPIVAAPHPNPLP